MRNLSPLLFLAVLLLIIIAAGYAEYSVWSECRETHSFLYCMRTLSK
jgi:hypothetical protein